MRTTHFVALLAALLASPALSHCEVPCGIYGDKARIDALYEHVTTIEKAMTQITELSGKNDAQSLNQAVRWITTKDDHATQIQHIVSQYFMTQRLDLDKEGQDRAKLVEELVLLHGMLRSAMKTKQTLDASHCAKLRKQIDGFASLYFSAEDLEHIREDHGKHAEHEAGGKDKPGKK